jgi:hypothetical protein
MRCRRRLSLPRALEGFRRGGLDLVARWSFRWATARICVAAVPATAGCAGTTVSRCGHGGVGLQAQIWALSGLTWVGATRLSALAIVLVAT